MQTSKSRLTLMERIKRALIPGWKKKGMKIQTCSYRSWLNGWKRNAVFKGKPLTSSMIRRVGSRRRAIELQLIK